MQLFTKAIKTTVVLGICSSLALSLQAQETDTSSTSVDTISAVTTPVRKGPTVSGTIRDASTGKPLSGIAVSVEGYSAGFTSDDGRFTISIPSKDAVIVVKAQGYQTKHLPIKGRKEINAALHEDTFVSLYDAASLPYANKTKNQTAFSIATINNEDNWRRISESTDSYLQGRVGGLNAIRRSGTPGIGANLFLRGFNSINATNQPLIVVDGMIYDISDYGSSIIGNHNVNPLAHLELKDVDNITVVKDGASMYGTKGANGVILITTGRAKVEATNIDFAAYGGLNSRVNQLPVMNSGQYRIYLSDVLKTTGLTDNQISALPFMNDNADPAINPNYYRYHYNTNWQDQVMNDGYNQNYYLKVTGGDNIATYGLSVGYLNNKGLITNTSLDRYHTRFNANLNLSSKLKGTANLSFTSNEQNLRDQGLSFRTNPLYLGLIKAPILPRQDVSDLGAESPNLANYDIFNISNPASITDEMMAVNRNYRFFGSSGFTYLASKSINVSTLFGITYDKVRENFFIPERGVAPVVGQTAVLRNSSGANVQRLFSIYNDTRLSYNKVFNSVNELNTNVGARFISTNTESDAGFGFNSATDEFVSVGEGTASLRRLVGDLGRSKWLNMYLNADYKLRNKYFLSFNLAVDGSSRFGKEADALKIAGNPFAVLPSLGASWLVSSEDFMAGAKSVDVFKLRASYGLVGNDDIGNYTSRQYYVTQSLLGLQGLVRGNIGNSSIKWETVEKLNGGVDLAFFNERLSISADVFSNNTRDMLIYEPVTTVSGFNFALTNNGGMRTNGLEFEINSRLLNKKVKWDLGLNLLTYKNKITSIPDGRMISSFGGATILSEVGRAANLFYGYQSNGIFRSESEAASSGLLNRLPDGTLVPFKGGDVRFVNAVDTEADKLAGIQVIDENDMQVIGNPNPDVTGMFSNRVSYKRWSFDAAFSFSLGNDIYNGMRARLESMAGPQNQIASVVNRWRVDGQETDMPRAAWGDPSANSRFSDRWIEKGSYLRLRTASVSYNLPSNQKVFKYATVYLTANNLFTLTKYLGYDPEFSATSSIIGQGVDVGLEPQFRTTQLGVKIGL
ncbi:SusC/RagA family TonB-linked outer membrane protein [Pedobacter sp. SYSU D00535]|uniref:SusC/RagA family TonB-linked outer membrane protein n=1 Tax=Pedobacter sp. SYSU D00535 TaxID=2810308 RepID=UPI001A96D30F|nr:SusC/RagA family TonB-linked outer membrane protein [Pedobacter sp. SYSU D00535]